MCAIWAELLEREVGPEDNFFEVGGHSLLAIRLLARLRTELGVKLTLKALIEAPTIRELAAKIDGRRQPGRRGRSAEASAPTEGPADPARPRDRPLRCSFAQEQLWLVDQLTPGSAGLQLLLADAPAAGRSTWPRSERAWPSWSAATRRCARASPRTDGAADADRRAAGRRRA